MSFIDQPISILNMGMRHHEAIQHEHASAITKMMQTHDWTCSRCGIRLKNFMHVDHAKGHNARDASGLLPICSFCHDQDHLIWAASCRRIVPIIATTPKGVLTNDDISRIAWAFLSLLRHEDTNPNAKSAATEIVNDMRLRRAAFQEEFGSKDADSFIEAVYRFLDGAEDEAPAMASERKLIVDQCLSITRFIPCFLAGDMDPSDPAAFLSTWGPGGFASIDDSEAKLFDEIFPISYDPDDILSGVRDIMSRSLS